MNYSKIYNNICESSRPKNRESGHGVYYERHHIIPRSFGGSDDESNLVLLTGREHFICHALLVRINQHDKPKYKKMLHALMLFKANSKTRNHNINSRLYESFRKKYSKIRSEARKNVPLSEEHKRNIGLSRKKSLERNVIFTDEVRMKISIKAKERKRKPFSDEYKKKHSEIMKVRHRHRDKSLPN